MRFLCVTLALLLSGPVAAQTNGASGLLSFDYRSNYVFIFNDVYGAEHGIAIDVPFRISVPRHDGVVVENDLRPDSGAFVTFNFSLLAANGTRGPFLENLQITTANIPLFGEVENPSATRAAAIVRLLETDVFALVSRGLEEPRIEVIETIPNAAVPGATHMIVMAYDARYDDRVMVRAVIFPHSAQAASYLAVATINLDIVPATNIQEVLATNTGRAIASFQYLPQ